MNMEGRLQIICDALVACLEEVPRSSFAQATTIIQQMILQLLHKLSEGKVTKVFFDHLDENSVAVRQVAEPEEKQEASTGAEDGDAPQNNKEEVESCELCTATEVPEEEAKEIELHIENPQVSASASKDVVSILRPDVKMKRPVLAKVSSEEAKQLLQAKWQRMTYHDGSHVFVCSVCQRPFKEKAKLKRHLLIHAGIKPFTCDICAKNFTQKTHLKDHLNTHTSERKNKCPDCGRKFSFARNLRRHQKLHSNERAYCCDECPARFVSTDKLYLHSLQHSGHKPYICSSCGRGFRRPDYLKGHKCSSKPKDNRGIRIIHLPAPKHNRKGAATKGTGAGQTVENSSTESHASGALGTIYGSNSDDQPPDKALLDKESDALIVKQEDLEVRMTHDEAKVIFVGSPEVQLLEGGLQQLIQGDLSHKAQTSGSSKQQVPPAMAVGATSGSSQPQGHTSGTVVIRAPGTSLLKKNNFLNTLKNNPVENETVKKPTGFLLGDTLNQDDVQIMEIKTVVINESDNKEVSAEGSGAVVCSQSSMEKTGYSEHIYSPAQYSDSCSSSPGVQVPGSLQTLIEAATAVANSQENTKQ